MNDQPKEQFARNIVKVILYSSAILLNMWLLFVLWRDPMKRFRNSPSFIIANLALVDIVAAIGGLGSFAVIFMCNTCVDSHKLFGCIQTVGLQNSFVFITLLAFDRFLAISHPYRYNMIFGNKRCGAFLCILGWAIGLTLGPSVHYLELKGSNHSLVLHKLYVINVAVLAMITATLYPLNYYNYLRKKRFLSASIHPDQAMEDLRLAQKLSVSSMIAATVLLAYMAPYIITLVYSLNNCMKCLTEERFRKFWVNYQAVIGLILLINPIIYAWRLPLYRKSSIVVAKDLLNMIKRRRTANQSSDNSNNTSSRITTMLTSSTAGTNDVNVSMI
ncbi:adenosine receptor A1-like [Paramuricea clavata]|uniref:Adenosine receptor A1-like n=1 Tax=Paramuricea clavata TaxID=317549 RepID=A0A6S7J985_PARCT|nr:adenosine receptor A1-like [Paramuricea clavata]